MTEPALPPPLQVLVDDLSSAGPAKQLSPVQVRRLVQRALGEAGSPSPAPWSRAPRWALGAALVTVFCGGAAAAAWLHQAVSAPTASPPLVEHGGPLRSQVSAPTLRPPAPSEAEPELVAAEPPVQASVEAKPTGAARSSASSEKREDLLARANRLRGEGRYREAEKVYLNVVHNQPGTPAAYVASVAAAQLQLGSRPASAIQLLESARRQQPGGALDREIRQALADAHRGTGNAAAEARELRALIRQYPGTPTARAAEKRLGKASRPRR